MTLEGIARFQVVRVNPFEGLIVDATTWGDAHGYHRDQQRLHGLVCHGAGIVAGLEVVAHDPPDLSVVIQPGVAVDGDGNLIMVAQAQRYYLQPSQGGTAYLVIQFREIPLGEGGKPTDSPDTASRIREAYRIQQRDNLPAESYVELARVRLAAQTTGVRDAGQPPEPQIGELDLRFRRRVAIAPQGEVAIGRLVPAQAGEGANLAHARGLANLSRELLLGAGVESRYLGAVHLGLDAEQCSLLYLDAGQRPTFAGPEIAALQVFLQQGGVLLVEPCAGDQGVPPGNELRLFFDAVVQRFGGSARRVERGHPLLDARHTFATPPAGALKDGEVLEAGGIVFSQHDYGCAWQGGRAAEPLDRQAIRTALELGINLAFYALVRKRSAAAAAL